MDFRARQQQADSGDGPPGAVAAFPYDRMTVERFRAAFPRARWRDDLRAWFVPGTQAERRLARWAGREWSGVLAFADARGRDAFAFGPIESAYLEVGDDLMVRTPYSRDVVAVLRTVPWASWDPGAKAWRVPFRAWEEPRVRWPLWKRRPAGPSPRRGGRANWPGRRTPAMPSAVPRLPNAAGNTIPCCRMRCHARPRSGDPAGMRGVRGSDRRARGPGRRGALLCRCDRHGRLGVGRMAPARPCRAGAGLARAAAAGRWRVGTRLVAAGHRRAAGGAPPGGIQERARATRLACSPV